METKLELISELVALFGESAFYNVGATRVLISLQGNMCSATVSMIHFRLPDFKVRICGSGFLFFEGVINDIRVVITLT